MDIEKWRVVQLGCVDDDEDGTWPDKKHVVRHVSSDSGHESTIIPYAFDPQSSLRQSADGLRELSAKTLREHIRNRNRSFRRFSPTPQTIAKRKWNTSEGFKATMQNYVKGTNFTEDELVFVHQHVRDACLAIKAAKTRKRTDIRGELFTRLRQSLLTVLLPQVGHEKPIFKKKLRNVICEKRWLYIEKLAEEFMNERAEDSADVISRLKSNAAGLKSVAVEMQNLNFRSKEVLKKIKEVQEFLEPDTIEERNSDV